MIKILLLLSGGAIGTLSRYAVSGLTHKYYLGNFPIGTLVVNLIGSFLIGLVWAISEQGNLSSNTRTFVFIGLFGSFTTFSAFSIETMNLFRDGETKLALLNVMANNILGILFVFGGFFLTKLIVDAVKISG